ncbi:MAG TPA: DUF748 domain-containing protein, partial [Burkholderiaceae bacterium]
VLDADLRLSFEQTPAMAVKLAGVVQAHGVKLADSARQELLSLDALKINVADLQPLARTGQIDTVVLEGPRLSVRRDHGGKLNLDFSASSAPATTSASQQKEKAVPPQPGWKLSVARASLRGGQVAWQDDSLPSLAHMELRNLALDATAVAWPLDKPLQFAGETALAGTDAKQAPAQLRFKGQATSKSASVAVSLQALPLELAAPYLGEFIVPRLTGRADADLGLAWDEPALVAHVARLTLDGVALACAQRQPCTAAPVTLAMREKNALAEIKQLRIDDAQVNLSRHSVAVGRIDLTQPRAVVERGVDGRWMFEQWQVHQAVAQEPAHAPVAKVAAQHAVQPATQSPWSVRLDEVALDGGALSFRDNVKGAPVALNVSSLRLQLKGFAPLDAQAKPASVSLSARVGAGRVEPGRLEYEGTLGLAPLAAQGRVQAVQLPLHAFEPYVADALNVDVVRADGSFKGQVRFTDTSAGPDVRVQGDAGLDELRVRTGAGATTATTTGTAAAGGRPATPRGLGGAEDLLNWKSLALRGLDVALAPGKATTVDVRETVLSDFFARIIVQESGRINLQDLLKTTPAPANTASAPAPASTPAAAPASGPAPVIRFGPVTLASGRVSFTDHFIKPNYSADLSELAGRLSAFSSVPPQPGGTPLMADLELRGRAEGTASLEITGKLNPLTKPLALDIQGRMRDLELPPLSPYTIKYAGHGVERGKMSMDVTYKVQPDGQLTASNRLILNQLAFGDEVQGAPATLPVS